MLIRRLLTYSVLSLVALGGFFGSVHIETANQRYSIVSVSYEGNGVYAACSSDPSSADYCNSADQASDAATAAKASSADQLKMWNSLIDGLNIILGIITAIVSPAIMFAGWLMSPDWTSGDLFGLRTPMYSLWVTVSNIVYFVYAILLILIALGTMFGKESFSYKVMLPKLALGILMVPFTWWFVQWTISLSAVVTASVITIPAETLGSKDGKSWAETPSIPKEITIDASTGDTSKSKPVVQCTAATCMTPSDFLRDGSGMYGYMMVYAYSVFKFQEVTQIPQGLDILKTGLGIVHQGVVAAIMFLVFGLLTLALVAMLLVRAIKLWVYAIFSPLFTFQFVAGSAMMGENKDTFTIKEFVGLCFVPAIVGLSLSFGLILINAVSTAQPGANTNICNGTKLRGEGCQIVSIMGNPKNNITRTITGSTTNSITQNIVNFGGIKMTFNGKAGASTDQAAIDGANSVTGVLNSAGGIFGTLIIDIIALVFIWMAFMAAKNVSKAVAMAVKPFEDIGSQVGKLASSIPKYTPIPGLGMSANSMGKVVTNAENAMIGASDKKFKESAAGKLFGGEKVVATVDENKLSQALKDANNSRHNGFKVAGDQIEKQAGKDIEYSSMFKDLIGSLKQFTDRSEKIKALETAGYSNDNAKKIVDQLMTKTNNEFDKNNIELMTGLKSRIGVAAGGAQNATSSINVTNNGSSKFTFTGGGFDMKEKTGEEIFTEINKNPANLKGMTDDQIKETLKKISISDGKIDEFIQKVETERSKKTS